MHRTPRIPAKPLRESAPLPLTADTQDLTLVTDTEQAERFSAMIATFFDLYCRFKAHNTTQPDNLHAFIKHIQDLFIAEADTETAPGEGRATLTVNREMQVRLSEAVFDILYFISLVTEQHASGYTPSNADMLLDTLISNENQRATTAMSIDVSGLDTIQRREGRARRDQLMHQVAELVRATFKGKAGVCSDHNGFVAVMDDPDIPPEELTQSSEAIIEAIEGLHRMLTVAVGMIYQEEGKDPLHKLELATRKAKATGGKRGILYTPKFSEEDERLQADRVLAMAILDEADHLLYPVFQLIHPVKAKSREPVKYEALLRTRHKEMSTLNFLRIMKEERLLYQVTRRLLPKVFAAVKAQPMDVSINITAEELAEEEDGLNFIAFMRKTLDGYNIPAGRVTIELVEWSDEDELKSESIQALKYLTSMGCKLALDDYGAKSSNLVRLMQLCAHHIVPDFLKIDAMLVKHYSKWVAHPEDSRYAFSETGLRTIIETAHSLQAKARKPVYTVAEFVDNAPLKTALEHLGIDYLQGYYLARPKELTRP